MSEAEGLGGMSAFDVSDAEADAAQRHLDECGPFCEHIEFCPTCVDEYGVCARHAGGKKSIRFRRTTTKTTSALSPGDVVAVPRSLLVRVLKAGRDGFGHVKTGWHAKDCDGCAALAALDGVLR